MNLMFFITDGHSVDNCLNLAEQVASSDSELLFLYGKVDTKPARILVDSDANRLGFISGSLASRHNMQVI